MRDTALQINYCETCCMVKYGLSVAEIREEQPMEYARLGNTGLMVSELCLGCMTFGREADEGDSREIVDRFLDAGGTFIDTADVYSKGLSEEIMGRAIKEVRDDVHGVLRSSPKTCKKYCI